MPLLHLKCDTRVEPLLTKKGMFWCPKCDENIRRDEAYHVGKRFFQNEKDLKNEKVKTKRKKLKGLKTKQRRIERRKNGS